MIIFDGYNPKSGTMANRNNVLHAANKNKKDEFYTQLSDIENELRHYKEHFKGKTVFCNCDDPRVSNFFHYFSYNFEQLGLKKLITTCYKSQERDLFSGGGALRQSVFHRRQFFFRLGVHALVQLLKGVGLLLQGGCHR